MLSWAKHKQNQQLNKKSGKKSSKLVSATYCRPVLGEVDGVDDFVFVSVAFGVRLRIFSRGMVYRREDLLWVPSLPAFCSGVATDRQGMPFGESGTRIQNVVACSMV